MLIVGVQFVHNVTRWPLCLKHREPNSIKISFIHLKHNVIYSFIRFVCVLFIYRRKYRATKTRNPINLTHAQRWNCTEILGCLAIVWTFGLHKKSNSSDDIWVRTFFHLLSIVSMEYDGEWTGCLHIETWKTLFHSNICLIMQQPHRSKSNYERKQRCSCKMPKLEWEWELIGSLSFQIEHLRHLNGFEPFWAILMRIVHFNFISHFLWILMLHLKCNSIQFIRIFAAHLKPMVAKNNLK